MSVNQSSQSYIRETNSKLECLTQIKPQVSKISGIETTLQSLNANVQTALNLSILNRQCISIIAANQQQSILRIGRNKTRINEISELIGASSDMPHSSSPSEDQTGIQKLPLRDYSVKSLEIRLSSCTDYVRYWALISKKILLMT